MTNEQLKSLKPGDTVTDLCNGRLSDPHVLIEVGRPIECINERSGSFGHYARRIEWASPTGNGSYSTHIESDEYTSGAGYPTHDKSGRRLRGWELVAVA